MDERVRFIGAILEEKETFSALCLRFQISRKTGYKWFKRYQEEGPGSLTDHEPIAKRMRHRLPEEVVFRIVEVRKEYPTWGPEKISAYLRDRLLMRSPAPSTIGVILKQYGLISKCRKRRPQYPRSPTEIVETTRPNDTWCIDFKGNFVMKNGQRCYPLTVTDHQTRYMLKCEAMTKTDEKHVRVHLERAFFEYGLPERIRSDNGPPFSSQTLRGLSKLSVWWLKLGIFPELIQPGHPEQNGRHERMHRTLGNDVKAQKDLMEQQLVYDHNRYIYNEIRPHEALGQKPPATQYHASNRILPGNVPDFDYPASMERRKLDSMGRIRFQGSVLPVSSVLAEEVIGIESFDNSRWLLHVGPMQLAYLFRKGESIILRPLHYDTLAEAAGISVATS